MREWDYYALIPGDGGGPLSIRKCDHGWRPLSFDHECAVGGPFATIREACESALDRIEAEEVQDV